MNNREQKLAIIIGAAVGLFLFYLLMDRVLISPVRDLDRQIADLQEKNQKLLDENNRELSYLKRIRTYASQTYDTIDLRASEKIRARLAELLESSGLADENLSLRPITGSLVPGNFHSIGWSISARGPLTKIINFLYLLDNDPRVHRIDGLSLTPLSKPGEVDVQLRYMTLILDPVKGEKPFAGTPVALPPINLKTPVRSRYQLIAIRDILRPYIPRPPGAPSAPIFQPPQQAAVPDAAPPPPIPADADQSRFRVVGLPAWHTVQQVIIADRSTQQTSVYKPGDPILTGKIVMVDYRAFPRHDQPLLFTQSRVILSFGNDLYAVDLGSTLADRYKLEPGQIPSELTSIPTSRPASTTEPNPAPDTQPSPPAGASPAGS